MPKKKPPQNIFALGLIALAIVAAVSVYGAVTFFRGPVTVTQQEYLTSTLTELQTATVVSPSYASSTLNPFLTPEPIPGATTTAAQATSTISGLSYPSSAIVGSPVVVSFDVAYSIGSSPSLWLMTAIGCGPNEPNCNSVSPSGVTSTPFPCNSANPFGNQYPLVSQSCYLTVSSGGSEFFSYRFSFSQTGTYQLTALSQLNVLYNSVNIPGSWSISQTMVITVNSS